VEPENQEIIGSAPEGAKPRPVGEVEGYVQ